MAHTHSHDDDTYYLDQLCMIGICAAFGAVCLGLYFWNTPMLQLLLADQFHPFVLFSGVGLMVLVAVRSISLWHQAARAKAAAHTHTHKHEHHHHDHAHGEHGHDHDHGGCCGHDHEHDHAHAAVPADAAPPAHDHAHDHHHHHGREHAHHHHHDHGDGHDDHDHAWAPWRYVVLLVPIMLFLLNLPAKGLDVEAAHVDVTREVSGWGGVVALGPLPLQQVVSAAVATVDPLAKQVPVVLDGKQAELSDLKPGMRVAVRLFHDRRLSEPGVAEILAGTSADKANASDPQFLVGQVVSVNATPPDKELVVGTGPPESMIKTTFDLAQGPIYGIDFKSLEALAFSAERQKEWAGKSVRVVGQFAPQSDRHFTLARYRIQCCGADAVQLSIPMLLTHGTVQDIQTHPQRNDWVEVVGRVEFREQPGRGGKVTVLVVPRPTNIKKTAPEPDPYIR